MLEVCAVRSELQHRVMSFSHAKPVNFREVKLLLWLRVKCQGGFFRTLAPSAAHTLSIPQFEQFQAEDLTSDSESTTTRTTDKHS